MTTPIEADTPIFSKWSGGTISAACTWGEGPDVCIVVNSPDGAQLQFIGLDNWKDAVQLAADILQCAMRAKAINAAYMRTMSKDSV